jgi:hypothetical protein
MEKKEQDWISTVKNLHELIKAQKYSGAITLAESSTSTIPSPSIEGRSKE